jgi:hypothetical protein
MDKTIVKNSTELKIAIDNSVKSGKFPVESLLDDIAQMDKAWAIGAINGFSDRFIALLNKLGIELAPDYDPESSMLTKKSLGRAGQFTLPDVDFDSDDF